MRTYRHATASAKTAIRLALELATLAFTSFFLGVLVYYMAGALTLTGMPARSLGGLAGVALFGYYARARLGKSEVRKTRR